MTAASHTGGRWARRLLVLLIAVIILPPALFFLTRGVLAAANTVLERRYPPPGRMIPVGDHRLHLFCQGSGTPTVVIEPGLGVDWVAWTPVVTDLARSGEVCVYDRAGYGWSEPGPFPRTAQQIAAELHELLSRSEHSGPFVLVAHSFGGYVARVYAGQYGSTLAGVVLADPSEQDPADIPRVQPKPAASPWTVSGLIDRLPPLGWDRVKRLYRGDATLPASLRALPPSIRSRAIIRSSLDQLAAEQSELDSRRPSQQQATAAVIPPDVPFVVITPFYRLAPADGPSEPTPAAQRERQRALAASAALGTQVFAEQSGHFVQIDQPDLLLKVIRDVVSRAQGRR